MSGAENSGGIRGIHGFSLVVLLGGTSSGHSLVSACSDESAYLKRTASPGLSLNFPTCGWP